MTAVLCALTVFLSGCGVESSTPAPEAPQYVVDIIRAVDAHDYAGLKTLLDTGATPTPAGSPLSPLHAALRQVHGVRMGCDATSLKLLLDHGADPNFVDDWSGFAPLEEALSTGDLDCARLLKASGADIARHGKPGHSMLVYAVKGAVLTGDTSVLELALSWGVDPNSGDSDGDAYTALHEAAGAMPGQDAIPVIRELLRAGADPCIVNRDGATAWDFVNAPKQQPAMRTLLADAMAACPPTGKGRYYEFPTWREILADRW